MRAVMLLAVGAVMLSSAAGAEVVTACDKPAGRTAALAGSAVQWEDDGLSQGKVSILREAGGSYDVRIENRGTSFTAREDGASIFADPGPDSNLTLVVRYPLGTVETYVLALSATGAGTLLWSSMKNHVSGITRGSIFTASCRRP